MGGFSLLPIQEIKRNVLNGPKFSIRYWRISVTLGSGIAGFNCTCLGQQLGNTIYNHPSQANSWNFIK